jgi:hypothetical protein
MTGFDVSRIITIIGAPPVFLEYSYEILILSVFHHLLLLLPDYP